MKKPMNYLLSASVLALTFVATTANQTANAQTCVNAPTCAELGYTLTSATTCAGTPLKCPFDKTKYYCTTKAEAAAAAMPDYSKAENRSCGNNYTAASDGYILGVEAFWDNWSGCKQFSGYYVSINNYNVRISERIHGNYVNSWMYPVKKGYKYFIPCTTCRDGNYAEYHYRFVPLS